jgi:hypothetical protein
MQPQQPITQNTTLDTTSLPERPEGFNVLLDIKRFNEHAELYPELKDPTVVQLPDDTFMMYTSIGNSITQEWIVGRFVAVHPAGPWTEVEPVIFEDIYGPQLCAPAVTIEQVSGQTIWKMYIQTACFEENGVIVLATSTDGRIFKKAGDPLATRETIVPEHQSSVIGVYDVGISEIKTAQDEILCMLFSGYRRVGCGDLYVSYRNKNAPENEWSPAQRLLAQEEVPFHNNPAYEHFEWGLEGAKMIQLSDDCFMLIGVCFLPKPEGFLGTRQRVFFAGASSLNGPFIPMCTPFTPFENQGKAGENGHPDTLILGNDLWIIYQERFGDGLPWHLRVAKFDLVELREYFQHMLASGMPVPPQEEPAPFHSQHAHHSNQIFV